MNRVQPFESTCALRAVVGLILSILFAWAQRPPSPDQALWAQLQSKLQQIATDKPGFVTAIVQRWESDARASGRWDPNYAAEMFNALMSLQPLNLVAASAAPTYEGVMNVLATGSATKGPAGGPNVLGDALDDLVYTPIAPCRIVDSRSATRGDWPLPVQAGLKQFQGGHVYTVDMDGPNFSSQGGSSSGCGIPFGVAQAVHMTLTVTNPSGSGFLTAWRYLSAQPLASFVDWVPGQTLGNTATVPTYPGAGDDFDVYVSSNVSVVIDVVGYLAAPQATPLDCTSVNSPVVNVPVNVWTSVDVSCPAGVVVTGGGFDCGVPGVSLTSVPNGNGWRTWAYNQTGSTQGVITYAQCCRIPGR
jgi:hypothetical protein